MSVHSAELGDIYRDKQGVFWQVIAVCHEPTITVEKLYTMDDAMARQGELTRMGGGVGGFMWDGFTKLSAKERSA